MISVLQLGIVDYATALLLQRKLVDLRKQNRVPDVLLLLEHSPVITLGRNAKATNVLAPGEELAERGVEVFECDRGGDVTFHGAGQLVAYPIFDLRGFSSEKSIGKTLGVVEFVRWLEEVVILTCAEFHISTERLAGLTGVWTANRQTGASAQSKIAAIGVHISRSVTSHGLALNVNTDLSYFNLIVPCGITSRAVTSMEKELGTPLAMAQVADALARNFGVVFRQPVVRVETLDSLIGTPLDVPMKPPVELRRIHGEEETFSA
jgi:lipoyl(octanoyl) transferase